MAEFYKWYYSEVPGKYTDFSCVIPFNNMKYNNLYYGFNFTVDKKNKSKFSIDDSYQDPANWGSETDDLILPITRNKKMQAKLKSLKKKYADDLKRIFYIIFENEK